MTRIRLHALCIAIALNTAAAAQVPSPEEFLGRKVGEDRFLAPYPKVVEYLDALDAASDRVTVRVAGKSTLGNDMLLVILTSEGNRPHLERYREIARRLANPDALSEREARTLLSEGRTIVLVTGAIHATEVGAVQMSMEFAHEVATTRDPEMLAWLDDVILLLMPSINPDGQVMVVDWYNRYLGTEYEGGSMPWLYHHYAGHDNNRDFFMLTQKETRVVNDVLYHRWFPQVFLDQHQMGSTGPRMFVPPQTDPLSPEVHSLIYRLADLLGTAMELRLEEAGKKGVGHNMIFDSYWPGGSRNTAWFKNVTGLLTEVASARIATPIRIEPGELRGGAKGFPAYQRRANYPSPWEGGWWRLRDIIDYELIATRGLLETCSRYRREILATFHRLSAESILRGESEPPYGFIVPPEQHDPVAAAGLIDLLLRHAVRVHRSEEAFRVGRSLYPAGSHVVLAAQPYRSFLLTMLQPQRYPEILTYPGGPIFPPYDVTSWSLPVSMGVEVFRADEPITARLTRVESPAWPGGGVIRGEGGWLIPHSAGSAFAAMNRLLAGDVELYWLAEAAEGGAPGEIYIPPGAIPVGDLESLSEELKVPVRPLAARPRGAAYRLRTSRIGLYKPWLASMDEGWTRWLLDQHGFPYENLTNDDIRSGAFRKKVDVLLLPDVEISVLKEGKPPATERRHHAPLPPEYSGGLEEEGGEQIKEWVTKKGGTVVALDSSSDYLIELLDLPVRNALEKIGEDDFSAPGCMLRIDVEPNLPVAYGMRPVEAAFFAGSPAFVTRPPDARFERRVVAAYPDHAEEILISGYLRGAELLERKAAVVDLKVMKGRVVLIGFRAQHRAQPHRTFKLLFNSLYLPGLEEVRLQSREERAGSG